MPGIANGPKDKLSQILNFLDDVEQTSRADIVSLASRNEVRSSISGHAVVGAAGSALCPTEERMSCPSWDFANDAAAVQSKMSMLTIEIEDKKKTIETLSRGLNESREAMKLALQEAVKEWENKMQKQKTHYETGIERHLKLVDRLLGDKTELTKRCELFTEELKVVEKKFQNKLEEFDEKTSKDLERHRKNWMSAEKLRRDVWEKEKVKEIKEMTIKGLQPDVERILAERKQERRRLEERHQEALDTLRREMTEYTHAQVRDARERLCQEHERALEHEREMSRKRSREELERHSVELQEERSKCAADLLAERRKHEQAVHENSDSFEARLREAVGQERSLAEISVKTMAEKLAAAEEAHREGLDKLRKQMAVEADERCRAVEESMKADIAQREAQIRQQMAKERDRHLDVLVERLSREHVEQQKSLREETDEQIRQARDEASLDAKHLSTQVEELKRKLVALGEERTASEQERRRSEERQAIATGKVAELEMRIKGYQDDIAASKVDAESLLNRHRDEIWKANEAKERELEVLQIQVRESELRAKEERLNSDKQQDLFSTREQEFADSVEQRVKQTVAAKNAVIADLRKQCAALENKVREFEYLLARQREELLGDFTRTSKGWQEQKPVVQCSS